MPNDSYQYAESGLDFAVYHVLSIIYLTIGLAGNLILLAAFYKQSKTERPYMYQVIFTVSKTLEIFWFGTFVIAYYWLGPSQDGSAWFVESYLLMYIFKFLGFGIHYTLVISSLLLSVAMAADRVLAILKPFAYLKMNHNLRLALASIVCFALGLLGGGLYFECMQIYPIDNHYAAELNENLCHDPSGKILFGIGISTRIIGLLVLWILNAIMVTGFKKHCKKMSKLSTNRGQDSRRKCAERTLLWLSIYQAIMMLINQTPHVIWHAMYYLLPFSFHYCVGLTVGAVVDALVMITDTLDFFIVIAINRRMRGLVVNVLPKRLFIK